RLPPPRRPRARGVWRTRRRRRVPRARFGHRQRSALEQMIVEVAHRVLGVGPGAEFHEGEPPRFARVAVQGEREVRERPNGGEVRPQLRLRHITLLPTSPRESRFSMAYSPPYEGN